MRYKEYNRNAVLEKAIQLFWQTGFNGCSINQLVAATGVNRFSLYHEFNNKEGILYASLELYKTRYTSNYFKILQDSEGEIQDILLKFYMAFLDSKKPMEGCYFIHVGTELADTDTKIRDSLNAYLNEIEAHIKELLINKNYGGNINLYAKHLVGLFCTAMSFCLIYSPSERRNYVLNGINIILSSYAENIK